MPSQCIRFTVIWNIISYAFHTIYTPADSGNSFMVKTETIFSIFSWSLLLTTSKVFITITRFCKTNKILVLKILSLRGLVGSVLAY